MRKPFAAMLGAVAFSAASLFGSGPAAAEDEITLCWAAWDPANALVELSKEFEAQSGHTMKFEFVPWPNFADRMLNELNSGGKLCDLMIGDSQWIGLGAEAGHYVKMNDFFEANDIDVTIFTQGVRGGRVAAAFLEPLWEARDLVPRSHVALQIDRRHGLERGKAEPFRRCRAARHAQRNQRNPQRLHCLMTSSMKTRLAIAMIRSPGGRRT